MRWEDPPEGQGNRPPGMEKYAAEAAELRRNPGKWGIVDSWPARVKKRGPVNDIKRGRYVSFRPAGAFEAVSRMGKNEKGEKVINLHVRYIGEGYEENQ